MDIVITVKNEFKNQNSSKKMIDTKLLSFCACNLWFHIGFSVIFSIYPPLANHQVGLDFTQIGWVFAANPIGAVLMSIFAGQQISGWGRKRCLILSQIAQIISIMTFSLLPFLTGRAQIFFILSLVSRFVQGVTGSIYLTTCFSYVPIFWSDSIEQKLGYIETVTGVSVLMGPFFGAIFNEFFGFSAPFVILSILISFGILVTHLLIPIDSELIILGDGNKHVPIIQAFKSPKILATLLALITVISASSYFATFYVVHMSSFEISQLTASMFQTLSTLGYTIGLQVVNRLPPYFHKAFKISLGVIFSLIATLLMAPFWTDQPSSAVSVIVGQLLVGTIQSFTFIPSIPQMTLILTKVFNDPDLKTKLGDISSSLFVMGLYFGLFISNVIGGELYDIYGGSDTHNIMDEKWAFYSTSMTMSVIILIALVIYMLYGDGIVGWKQTLFYQKESSSPSKVTKLLELQDFSTQNK